MEVALFQSDQRRCNFFGVREEKIFQQFVYRRAQRSLPVTRLIQYPLSFISFLAAVSSAKGLALHFILLLCLRWGLKTVNKSTATLEIHILRLRRGVYALGFWGDRQHGSLPDGSDSGALSSLEHWSTPTMNILRVLLPSSCRVQPCLSGFKLEDWILYISLLHITKPPSHRSDRPKQVLLCSHSSTWGQVGLDPNQGSKCENILKIKFK